MNKPPSVLGTIWTLISRNRLKTPAASECCCVGFVGNIPEPRGGAELFLQSLIAQLSELPVRMVLVRWQRQIMHYDGSRTEQVYRDRETIEQDADTGTRIHYLLRHTPRWLIPRLIRIFGLAVKATGFLHGEGVQVIHCHLLVPNIYYAFIAARILRVPLVVTIHGLVDIEQPGQFLHQPGQFLHRRYAAFEKRLLVRVLKNCDRVIAVSREIRDYCESLGIPNLEIKSGGIDTRYFSPAGEDECGILFIGNLTDSKGFNLLLQAYERLRGRISEPLNLAGKNPANHDFSRDPDISYLGVLSREDLRRAIQGSKLVVLPSKSEGLPLAVLEALSCNKPVLVTPVGELAHLIVDGENGFLCATGSVDSLADKLVEILGNYPQIRASLGCKPRDSVREYDIRHLARWHWHLYRQHIASAAGLPQLAKNRT